MSGEEAKKGGVLPPPEWKGGAPAGWYLDPEGAPLQRYWDGSAWTEDTCAEPAGAGEGRRNDILVTIGWAAALLIIALAILAAIAFSLPSD